MARRQDAAAFVVGTALLLGASACSGEMSTHPSPARDTVAPTQDPVDTSVFERAGGEGNAFVYGSPSEMARDRAVVASGKVVGFTDGYEVLERGSDQEGYDIRDYSVVMQVEVTHLWKDDGSAADDDGYLYLALSRGAEQEGVPDDGGPSTVTPVAEFAKAIPAGTPVVVMAGPMFIPDKAPGIDVIGLRRGVPSDAVLLSGWHPQALSFPDAAGTTSWRRRSLQQVEAELDGQF